MLSLASFNPVAAENMRLATMILEPLVVEEYSSAPGCCLHLESRDVQQSCGRHAQLWAIVGALARLPAKNAHLHQIYVGI